MSVGAPHRPARPDDPAAPSQHAPRAEAVRPTPFAAGARQALSSLASRNRMRLAGGHGRVVNGTLNVDDARVTASV